MTSVAKKRLQNDYKRLMQEKEFYVYAKPKENNILQWEAVIIGPRDTAWEGATLMLQLDFTEEYPNKPPQVKFLSEMFHPNVDADGRICLDILTNQWTPIYDVHAVLLSIQSLLSDPNPNSPANVEASKLFSESKEQYCKKVFDYVVKSWKNHRKNIDELQKENLTYKE